MTERERAERFLDNGTFAVKSWNEIFRELEMPEPTRQLLICDLMAFAREERARVWEEAKGLLEAQQCRNPFYGTALFKGETIKFAEWIDKVAIMFGQFAKQLREEGART